MYKSAPLPFTGQKRQFIRHYIKVLEQYLPGDGSGWTIVDGFGGSGLLSHVAKQTKPQARVIYNDFDGYVERLHHIPDTNRLRQALFRLLKEVPRETRLSCTLKASVQRVIERFDGYLDLHAVAAWLLFSGQQVASMEELDRKHFYNCIRRSDYPTAEGYMNGLEVRHQSYETLLPEFVTNPKALLVFDPPYVCTKQGAYRLEQYFGMVEFLRLMRLVRPPFVFFSSTRSEFMDYLALIINEKMEGWEKLDGYHSLDLKAHINKAAKYTDNLVFKFS